MLSNNYFNQDFAIITRNTYFPDRDPLATMDARNLFERIQHKVMAEKVWNWIRGRRSACLMDLDEVESRVKVINRHYSGLREVPLDKIRGSQGRLPVAPDYPFSETEIFDHPSWPKLHFVEREYAGDWTNWWIPNRACVEGMLRSAGFAPAPVPGTEVYLCRTVPPPQGAGPVYPSREGTP